MADLPVYTIYTSVGLCVINVVNISRGTIRGTTGDGKDIEFTLF